MIYTLLSSDSSYLFFISNLPDGLFYILFHLYLICVSISFFRLLSTSLLSFLYLLYLIHLLLLLTIYISPLLDLLLLLLLQLHLMCYSFCILFYFISIISLILDVQFLFFISFIPDAPLTVSFFYIFISAIADIYFLFSTSVLLDALVFFISKHILFHLYLMFHLLISFHLYLMFFALPHIYFLFNTFKTSSTS